MLNNTLFQDQELVAVTGHLSEGSFVRNVVVQIPKFDPNPNCNPNPKPSPNPNSNPDTILTLTLTICLDVSYK